MLNPDQNRLKDIAKEFNLKLILLFGSQVEGKTHQESDVDLAYLSERNLSFDEENLLNTRFCGLFQTDKGVDSVNLAKATPLFLKQVLDCHQILYQKSALDFSLFEVLVLQKYQEAKPLFEMRHQRLQEFVKSL